MVGFVFLRQIRLRHHDDGGGCERGRVGPGFAARQHAIAHRQVAQGDLGRILEVLFSGRHTLIVGAVLQRDFRLDSRVGLDRDLFGCGVDCGHRADGPADAGPALASSGASGNLRARGRAGP